MFRDDEQTAMVCDALTRWMGKGQLWRAAPSVEGGSALTETGLALKRRKAMSHGEALVFQFALSLWNGYQNKGPRTDELLGVVDGERLRAIGTLMLALASEDGSSAVDAWLRAHHPDLQNERETVHALGVSGPVESVPTGTKRGKRA